MPPDRSASFIAAVPSQNPWITPGIDGATSAIRLFCFPHAGGGPAFFRPWCKLLSPEIDVCRVALPGREARRSEAPLTRMEQLIGPLFDAILEYTDKPFAFFGHSMGATVAFELTRRFAERGLAGPSHLFVSGRRAPYLPARRRPFHTLPDDEFVRFLRTMNGTPSELLHDDNFVQLFLPSLRADFQLVETHDPLRGERFSCPVSAFSGDSDPEVNEHELDAWRSVTTGEFRSVVFSGDHFYLQPRRSSLLFEIVADLRRFVGARDYAREAPPRSSRFG